jgi:ubiquinone/menaquinone biosynthesis C-methylase UbiE
MLDLARVQRGTRVLDLATGRGEPAIPAAHRAGPDGFVQCIDPSAEMLEMARERAQRERLTNLAFQIADAASMKIPAGFDAALIRWGLMYMASPVAALERARRALNADARLVVAVWAEPERVPFFTLPRRLIEKYRPVPQESFDAPGIFHYARLETLQRDLESAGFRVLQTEEMDVPVLEVSTAAEAIDWERAFGMTKLLDGLPETTQLLWEKDFAAAAETLRKDGLIRLSGVTRIVVAVAR